MGTVVGEDQETARRSLACVVCDRDVTAAQGQVVAVVVAVGGEVAPRAGICHACLAAIIGAAGGRV